MSNVVSLSETLPLFSQIKPEELTSVIQGMLKSNRETIKKLLENTKDYTFENLVAPLEIMETKLNENWGIITHLSAVKDSALLRKVHDALLPEITEYYTELGQHEGLFQAFTVLADSKQFAGYSQEQRKIIENALRDFKLSGVSLPPAERAQFKAFSIRLSELENKFDQNIMDCTDHWTLLINDPKKLAGLPAHALELAKEAASAKGQKGYLLTLDFPCYDAVLTYAEEGAIREAFYKAYTTIASSQGEHLKQWDNEPLMSEIITLRYQIARLVGFQSYAEYSLATKMIKQPEKVIDFLNDFVLRVKQKAEHELQELQAFAKTELGMQIVSAWDIRYVSEKMRVKRYEYSEEALRAYFPENKVLEGLFSIVNKLYGISVKEITHFDKWHDSVRLFEVLDASGNLRGKFYLDLYARAHKRHGAWCGECRSRIKVVQENISQYPVAYVVANFTRPALGKPAFFTHDEVTTLFHEFGHCLHHIVTTIDYPSISGMNGVEWDAVELPSQLMENWCWEEQALALISEHRESKKPLPQDLFLKLKSSKNFQSALGLIRQLEFSLFDMLLHQAASVANPSFIITILDSVREKVSVIKPPAFNRFQNSFSHIFSGGYAAGYYSYLWSEVLSSDVYAVFKEKGIFDHATGLSFFSKILSQGGARDAMELFIAFRNRRPTIDALLKEYNLA